MTKAQLIAELEIRGIETYGLKKTELDKKLQEVVMTETKKRRLELKARGFKRQLQPEAQANNTSSSLKLKFMIFAEN